MSTDRRTWKALVTNDDGIESPGLVALAASAVDCGLDTIVAAPAVESSGTSASLMAAEDDQRIVTEQRTLPTLLGVPAYAVASHPGLIAFIAANGAFGHTPDLVLSGVNRGANVGRAVLHSGTVGAALTASLHGVRTLAVSLDVGYRRGVRYHWDTAADVARAAIRLLVDLEPGTVLNVNVPNVAPTELRPLRRARLAPFGMVQSRVKQLDDGTMAVVTVDDDDRPPPEPDTDVALLAAGHPTVTPLRSVDEDGAVLLPVD